MRMYDIIKKKKDCKELSKIEIDFVIENFTNGNIQDYQMSALLMAICINGMTKEETTNITLAMANSGDIVDLSSIKGIKVDKHSTGGVGDKTTLIISPIVSSAGIPIAKMSGRGLGHTGGTIDKLESITGLKTSFTKDEFIDIVNSISICVAGQSGNLAPADKKIYALRDVTATVDSVPLIAASIMSKKIAAGSDAILLDVKTGSGAFMKTLEDSILLAKTMVEIGESVGRKTVALITNMDIPLGNAIGNSLEIIEVVKTLQGHGPKDLTDVCISLAKEMLELGGNYSDTESIVLDSINSNKAFEVLLKMVKKQGGDINLLVDTDLFEKSKIVYEVKSNISGYVYSMDTELCGIASSILGAGRETENSIIDFSAGIILNKKTGDYVEEGEVIAFLHTSTVDKAKSSEEKLRLAYNITNEKPEKQLLIFAKVDKDKVTIY